MRSIASAFVAAALLSTSSVALAGSPSDFKTVEVKYSPKNLTTDRGVSSLRLRVTHAIISACGQYTREPSLDRTIDVCRRETAENVRPVVDRIIASARNASAAVASISIRIAS